MRILLGISALLLFVTASLPAHADYFLWRDPDSGLTVTFPDTWKKQNNNNPDDALSISAPSAGDDPTCKIKISEDRRYVIYPPRYGKAVQRDAVSLPFWQSYMGHYDDYEIDRVYDGAGLGRWHASYATASYMKRAGTAFQQRRALMFASLYNDKLYVVECSTLNHAYERWENNFRSIIKSIDFKKAYNELPQGYYDNFLAGASQYFWAQTGPEGTVGY
jgi:hypothetical protein